MMSGQRSFLPINNNFSRSSFDVSQVNKNLNARASIFVPSMSLRRKVSVPLSNYYLLPTTNHSPIRRQSERVERNSKNQFRSAISSMAGTAIAFGTGESKMFIAHFSY